MNLLLCVSILLPWSGALPPGGLSLQEEGQAVSDRKGDKKGSEPTVAEIRALSSRILATAIGGLGMPPRSG